MNHVEVKIAESQTHGMGLFVAEGVAAGEPIVTVISNNYQTQHGRYVNHSFSGNCGVYVNDAKEVIVFAKEDLPTGTEVLVCYEDFLAAYGFRPEVCRMVRFYQLEDIPKHVLHQYPDAYPPALL